MGGQIVQEWLHFHELIFFSKKLNLSISAGKWFGIIRNIDCIKSTS